MSDFSYRGVSKAVSYGNDDVSITSNQLTFVTYCFNVIKWNVVCCLCLCLRSVSLSDTTYHRKISSSTDNQICCYWRHWILSLWRPTTPPMATKLALPGPRFNMKMSSYQYRKSHCGDKTVVRSSYLHNGISYTGKMPSLYWIGALVTTFGFSNTT